MVVKNDQELKILKEGGKILAKILREICAHTRQGITTKELNDFAEKRIFELCAAPSFKGYENYPFSICTSLNEEIVHGEPSERKLQKGDILGIDIGVKYQGYFLDAAVTVPVGEISKQAQNLIITCKNALKIGIANCKTGKHLGDLGYVIQKCIESNGFKVIQELCGHGVGRAVHEEPQVTNFGKPKTGEILQEGQVIAIEPMIALTDHAVKKGEFLWATQDNSIAAHFEHTVLVTKKGGIILTQ